MEVGEIRQLGRHRLMCGDSTNPDDLACLLSHEKAEMMFTDPPYGVSYDGGHFHSGNVNIKRARESLEGDEDSQIYDDFLPLALEHVDGPCYVWFAPERAPNLIARTIHLGGTISALIVWNKVNGTYAAMNAQYKQRHECCLYFKPKGSTLRWRGSSKECTVWDVHRDSENKLHPTQKPVALAYRAIKNHDAQTVLDPFAGSGSTLIAADRLHRQALLMEIDPGYCEIICYRYEQHRRQPQLFAV